VVDDDLKGAHLGSREHLDVVEAHGLYGRERRAGRRDGQHPERTRDEDGETARKGDQWNEKMARWTVPSISFRTNRRQLPAQRLSVFHT